MTNLADKLEALEKAATPGPWDVDNEYDDDALYSGGGGCGRGFMNFYIGTEVDGKWCTLLDTVNSDHKLIEEDFDEDRKNSWDAIGHSNTNLIVGLVNNLPTIIRALRERDQAVEALRLCAKADFLDFSLAPERSASAIARTALAAIEQGDWRND